MTSQHIYFTELFLLRRLQSEKMAEVILPAIDVQKVHKAYNKKTPVLQGTDLMVRLVF